MARDILPDGSVRLKGDRCAFVFHRLRPGVLFITISGNDTGELGDAVLAEFDAELARAGWIALFFDTRDTTGIATAVRERWTEWFRENRPRTRKVVVLVSSRFIELTVAATRLFSGTTEIIDITSDPRALVAAIAQHVPGFSELPSRTGRLPRDDREAAGPASSRGEPPAKVITRDVTSDGAVRLSNGRCTHVITTLRRGVVRVTITGDDTNELSDATFDLLDAALATARPLHLFCDLHGAASLTADVREGWTAWLRAHQQELARVHILAGSAFVERMASLSKLLLGSRRLMDIHTDPAAFDAELARTLTGA